MITSVPSGQLIKALNNNSELDSPTVNQQKNTKSKIESVHFTFLLLSLHFFSFLDGLSSFSTRFHLCLTVFKVKTVIINLEFERQLFGFTKYVVFPER